MMTRRGASLVELLVIMSACTSVLTTSVVLVHRAMNVQSKTRSFLAAQRSALRLSDQFRRDVHRAADVPPGDAPQNEVAADVVLQLQMPDAQTVEYRCAQGVVRRTLSAEGRIVAREEYAFPPSIELAIRREDDPRRIILSITNDLRGASESSTLPAYATPLELQVEACLGRDPYSHGPHSSGPSSRDAAEQEAAK